MNIYFPRKINLINLLLVGVFLLSFASIGSILLNDVGKYLSLGLGFLFLLVILFRLPKFSVFLNFLLISTFYYIILFLVSFFNSHEIDNVNIVFGLVCFVLLQVGFLIGNSFGSSEISPSDRYVVFISVLTIFGVLMLIQFQSNLVYQVGQSTRGYGENSELNPVGISYILGLMLLINFAIFVKVNITSKIVKLLLILSIVFSAFGMIATLSRGGVLYVLIILLFFSYFKFKYSKINFHHFPKYGLALILLVSILAIFVNSFPIVGEKLDQINKRFLTLIEFVDDSSNDASSEERLAGYQVFFDQFHNLIFYGLRYYKPYPHNQFVEIIMRWGLFGLPLLAFSIWSFVKALKLFKYSIRESSPVLFLLVLLFLFSYFQSMTSLSLEMNRFLWLGFGFIGGYGHKV